MIVAAVIIVVIIVVAALYYFTVYSKPSSVGSQEEFIQIGGAIVNSTVNIPATYYPLNFTVVQGLKVVLLVQNTDNQTHGLAVPQFNVNTGPMSKMQNVTLSFVVKTPGNYTYDEPSSDCGSGNCDTNETAFNGWFIVLPNNGTS
jgi:heme/copper-type cytochrome/quinol oxidase subunit 2